MKSTENNTCECGGKYLGKNKKQHDKTKKHQLFYIAHKVSDKELSEEIKKIQKKINNK